MSTDFAPHNMTSDSAPSPYVASGSAEFSPFETYRAFDGTVAGAPHYALCTGAGVCWFKLDTGSGNSHLLVTYDIQVNDVPEPNRAPKTWTMEGSNDNSTWDTLDTVSSETSWGSSERRSYSCDVTSTHYRYFRVNVTANNGDGTYTQIGELYLFEPSPIDLSPGAATLTYTGGTPVVSFSGSIDLAPGAATLTYTGGTPVVSLHGHIDLAPGPASLTYVGGTPVVTRSINLAPGPAQVVYRTYAPGVQLIRSAAEGTQLIIGGVSYGTWKAGTFNRSENIGSTYSASVQMRYRGGDKPAVNQELALFVDSVKRFGGYVKSVAEEAILGDPFESTLTVSMDGYGALLDRIVAAKLYTLPIGALVAIIVYDLWYDHLRPLG